MPHTEPKGAGHPHKMKMKMPLATCNKRSVASARPQAALFVKINYKNLR